MICRGVCHTDLHVKNADFDDVFKIILGYEGIGKVVPVYKMRPKEDIDDIFDEMEADKIKRRMVLEF